MLIYASDAKVCCTELACLISVQEISHPFFLLHTIIFNYIVIILYFESEVSNIMKESSTTCYLVVLLLDLKSQNILKLNAKCMC